MYDIEGAKYFSVMEEDDASMKSRPTDGVDGEAARDAFTGKRNGSPKLQIDPEIRRRRRMKPRPLRKLRKPRTPGARISR